MNAAWPHGVKSWCEVRCDDRARRASARQLAPRGGAILEPDPVVAGGAYKHDVAIFAPWAGPLYAPGSTVPTGGAERQSWYLAHALAARGLRVCHVVFHVDGIVPEDRVSVLPIRTDSWRRHFTLYARDVAAAMRRADAAVYVQRTASFDTGAVALAARLFRRRFVFSSSSSTDLARRPPL